MFRFTTMGARAVCATATLLLAATVSRAQSSSSQDVPAPAADNTAQPVQQTPPVQRTSPAAGQRGRRFNANRQARIERNIHDAYSHRWEVAGGGGYLRFHPGSQLLRINEVNFWANGTRQWNERWGVVGDVRGNYGNAKIPNQLAENFIYRPQISHYNFMAGVQYRFIGKEKYSIGAQGEGGVTLSKFGGDAKGLPSQTIGLWKDSSANPTVSASVNLDYNVYNNLAARVQPTYVLTTFGSTVQNSLGVNVGIVYRFGRQ